MDGFNYTPDVEGNAALAKNSQSLMHYKEYPHTLINASELDVGFTDWTDGKFLKSTYKI